MEIRRKISEDQLSIAFNFLPPRKQHIIRACPNNPRHEVHGDCVHLGGKMWFCADCGIEWRLDRKKENMVYYQIDENGDVELLKRVALYYFPGVRQKIEEMKQSV